MSGNTRKGLSLVIAIICLGLLILLLLSASTLPAAAQGSPQVGDVEVLDPYPPPTSVTATDGTFLDRIRILWDSIVQADYYEIFRANSADGQKTLAGTSSDVQFEDTAVNAEVLYYYWVRACNPEDCSELSAYDTGWRQLNIPDVPASVQASDGTYANRIQVSWDESPPASYYEVYRAEAAGGAKTLVRTITGPPFEDRDVDIESIYYYWVIACGVDGCSDFSAYDTGFRSMPAVPGGLQASDGTFLDRIEVKWSPVTGVDFYELYRADSPTDPKELVSTQVATLYEDWEVTVEEQYTYWVRACVVDGCSDYSAPDSGYRALPAAPLNLSASDGLYTDKILITWNSAYGAEYYELYRADLPSGTRQLRATTTVNNFADMSLPVLQEFYYWVKACNAEGCSPYSQLDSGFIAIEAPVFQLYTPLVLRYSQGNPQN